MPSVSVSPLQLRVTGNTTTYSPARVTLTPLALSVIGADVSAGPGTNVIALQAVALKLDRMLRQVSYFDPRGLPTMQMQLLHQRHCEALETFADRISQQVSDNTNLLTQILAAQAKSDAALATATEVKQATSLAGSYTDPVGVLTADSAGTVTIAAHTRRYLDGTSVAVNGGSLTSMAGYVTVYYDDAGREGGAVAYQGATSAVSQEGNRHIVGSVQIPGAGEPPVTGSSPTGPGFVPPGNLDGFDSDYQ